MASSLFDGKFPTVLSSNGFINQTVGAATNEAHDFVFLPDAYFTGIARRSHLGWGDLWEESNVLGWNRCFTAPYRKRFNQLKQNEEKTQNHAEA